MARLPHIVAQWYRREPDNEDGEWVEMGVPNTVSTAERWAREQCKRHPDHPNTRVTVDGDEIGQWTYSERRRRAVKIQ